MALDAFSSQDRAKIMNAVRLLENADRAEALQSKTAKLPTSEPMYIMRAAPAIRLIYRLTPSSIEVLDVVQKATLDAFLNENVKPAVKAKSAPATQTKKARTTKSNMQKATGGSHPVKLKKTSR